MSTIKADTVTAVAADTNLSLTGSGTGGVKVTDYLIQTKGSDISSATSLTLGKDGNLFDVTGTTTITSIGTQGIGSYVTLHFDGILTFTHHSTDLILPGAANITTAVGDIAVMYEYATGDWRCVSYSLAAIAPGGGTGWVLIGTQVASTSASMTQTGLDSTYDHYAVGFADIIPASSGVDAWLRFGDSSGIDSASGDYSWGLWLNGQNNAVGDNLGNSHTYMAITSETGEDPLNSAGDGVGMNGMVWINQPGDSTNSTGFWGGVTAQNAPTTPYSFTVAGHRKAAIVLDRVQMLFSSGNIASGRMTVWGISHV